MTDQPARLEDFAAILPRLARYLDPAPLPHTPGG
jgi:hypothetical protein